MIPVVVRVLAGTLPDEAEALGLVALMLHVAARRSARRGAMAKAFMCRSRPRM
jgi:predicted RNA polymerase sigma factor